MGTAATSARRTHQHVVDAATPCLNLFHFSVDPSPRRSVMPTSSIARMTIEAKPFLFVRRRVAPAEIPKAVGEGFGAVMGYGHSVGAVFAGRPLTRYPEMSPGMMTLDIGFPLAAPVAGNGTVECGTLSGGAVVFGIHEGAYNELGQSYTALEKWMDANGVRPAGAPWESYITDPAEHPNPADWRTEIYWPCVER
jgi:AraC family transcriptional regulator